MSHETDICEICKKKLVSVQTDEQAKVMKCNYCGKEFRAKIYCDAGHYICDSCHAKDAIDFIRDFVSRTTIKNPYDMIDIIMTHPSFKMYGPEHHILTPVVLLTMLKNNGCKNANGQEVTIKEIEEAIRRAKEVPGGWCGYYGSCGAGIGSGIALSVFTHATPSTHLARTISNLASSRSINCIADNLEHCCKRSVRYAIREAINVINENFNCKFDFEPESCIFSSKNQKCEKNNCPFN